MGSKNFDAKALLEKHGWKKGSGLGKNESGIKEAIRVDLKMDKAGMGFDASEKFSYQWWDHVFNSAAKSIEVVTDENGISFKRNSTVDVSTKKKSKISRSNTPLSYGNFVKTATLTPGGKEVKSSSDDSDSDSSSDSDAGVISKMTDEELFKACAGMTVHKGARHGINMKAKLLRAQQQEEQFLRTRKSWNAPEPSTNSPQLTAGSQMEEKSNTEDVKVSVAKEVQGETEDLVNVVECKSTEKKKKKRKRDGNFDAADDSVTEAKLDSDDVKSKSTKRRRTEDDEDNATTEASVESEETGQSKKSSKKQKKQKDDVNTKEGLATDNCESKPITLKSESKRRHKRESIENVSEERLAVTEHAEDKSENKEKKLKKKKRQQNDEQSDETENIHRCPEVIVSESQDKNAKKKKKKSDESANTQEHLLLANETISKADDTMTSKKSKKPKLDATEVSNTNAPSNEEEQEQHEVKKMKKTKKKQKNKEQDSEEKNTCHEENCLPRKKKNKNKLNNEIL